MANWRTHIHVNTFLKSTSFWTIFLLVLLEVIVRMSWQEPQTKTVDSTSRIVAFKKFCQQNQSDNVVILGSSLALAANFERGLNDQNFRVDDWSKSISNQLGKNVTVINLAWHAGMIVDCNKTLEAYLHSKKHPQIVVLMTAPRDFGDNLTPRSGVLAGNSLISPTELLGNKFVNLHSPSSMFPILLELILPPKLCSQLSSADDHSAAKDLTIVFTYYSELFKNHSTAHTYLLKYFSSALHRPQSLAESAIDCKTTSDCQLSKKTVDTIGSFERDIAMYKQRYNPPNFASLEQSGIELQKLIATCKENQIHLVVVNMPLTSENRSLITPEFYTGFLKQLEQAKSSKFCCLINASEASFSRSDFHDSVHLNLSGRKKLEGIVLPVITNCF